MRSSPTPSASSASCPHHLVASFRSTLDEIVQSDLVLHVIDRSHPRWEEQKAVAEEVMKELGIDPANILEVHNKIDRLPAEERISRARAGLVSVSAETGEGIEALQAKIARALGDKAHSRPQAENSKEHWEKFAALQASEWDGAKVGEAADPANAAHEAKGPSAPGGTGTLQGASAPPPASLPPSGPKRIGGAAAGAPRSRKRPR